MTAAQATDLKRSAARQKLNDLLAVETRTAEQDKQLEDLSAEAQRLEVEYRAQMLAEPDKDELIVPTGDPELREIAELRSKSSVTSYIKAASEMRAVDGAEAEFNAALGMARDQFPMTLLTPETRQTTAVDVSVNQGTWLDRLFSQTAAQRLGVSFRSVGPGVASFPVTTAGAAAGQLDKSGATPAAAWTIGVTEMKPKRNAVHAIFNIEDVQRIGPGLEAALQRDLRAALVEGIDATIFKGDATPTAAAADIVGLQTAAIAEVTLTQASKILGQKVLEKLAGFIDGQHAISPADLRIVASVGSNVLWLTTIQASTVENQTIAQFLRASGIDWTTRGGIDTATANGDFGAYIGLASGVEGAAIAAVWESASLIRDNFSGSSKGEISLVLNTLWDFAVPRPSSFKRLKYVS